MEEALLPAGNVSVQRPGPGEAVEEKVQPGDAVGAGDRDPSALPSGAPGGLVAVPQPFRVGEALRVEGGAGADRLLGSGGDGEGGAEEQKQAEGPELFHIPSPFAPIYHRAGGKATQRYRPCYPRLRRTLVRKLTSAEKKLDFQ